MKTPEGAEFIPTEKRTSKIKVLFVDDETPIIESYTRYFEKQGFDARGIGTAAEAVEIYSDWQPDVVVVDVHLAEESGLALLGRLSRLGAKVIVLTHDDSPENLITAMNRNAREFLVKPVDMARLQKAIQLCA